MDRREFYRQLGASVRAARVARGLAQRELGYMIGLSRPSIANLEAGRQDVSAYQLALLLDRLDVLIPFVDPPAGEDGYRRG